ncbi:putative MFS family arabinose efflux permease [Nocardioides albertanoniae]|uniref:Putative MFS family arabinose efflux permease n=1 Tax=Nocardioides albertanoniae TaxID=1175486 RepID=A0A543A316_9ACTN|nr:MFS transporter [Nocardioides albertanoniae]TQL66856.1 putative MFS family arabinose efflux permease [Nocardioides albertanoniae]
MRHLLIDITPLRTSPAFRRFFIGRAISGLGGQITIVAVMFQVWEATHSPFWSGSVAIAQLVPMLTVGLWGGSVADRVDRRTILMTTNIVQLVLAVLLMTQALWLGTSPSSLGVVLLLVAAMAAAGSVAAPAGMGVIPRLLPADQVGAGLALNRLSFQGSMLLGPALGGLIIGYAGLEIAYAVDAASFAAGFLGVAGLPRLAPAQRTNGGGILEGLRFAATQPVIRGVLLVDLAATVLAMPVSLFPVINEERFGGDPRTLGLFLTSIAVGGVAASLVSGTFTRRTRPGLVTIGAAAVWGISVGAVGLVTAPWLCLGLLAIAGAADSVSVVTRGTLIQLAVPDDLRGRTAAVEMIIGTGGPELGDLRGGAVAQLTSGSFALVSGGIACLLALAAVGATSRPMLGFRTPSRSERSIR